MPIQVALSGDHRNCSLTMSPNQQTHRRSRLVSGTCVVEDDEAVIQVIMQVVLEVVQALRGRGYRVSDHRCPL